MSSRTSETGGNQQHRQLEGIGGAGRSWRSNRPLDANLIQAGRVLGESLSHERPSATEGFPDA